MVLRLCFRIRIRVSQQEENKRGEGGGKGKWYIYGRLHDTKKWKEMTGTLDLYNTHERSKERVDGGGDDNDA